MRYITSVLIIVLCVLSMISCSKEKQSTEIVGWIEDYQTALEIAADTEKTILVNFTGSDWCGWCMLLDEEVFSTDEFKNYALENLVLLKIDFLMNTEQPEDVLTKNTELARKYEILGFPTIILLDKNENVIARTGYVEGGSENYINHLKELQDVD